VQVIDNQERNSKLGTIFNRIGPGKLLVCAMDLETDAERPAAVSFAGACSTMPPAINSIHHSNSPKTCSPTAGDAILSRSRYESDCRQRNARTRKSGRERGGW
jgi:hypothetical protein